MSVDERITLVQQIWDSVAADAGLQPPSAAERAELDRRIAEDDAAPGDVAAWETLRLKHNLAGSDALSVAFRRQARREFDDAGDWYEKERIGLGLEFLVEIGQLLNRVASTPNQFPIIHRDVRKAVTWYLRG